MKNKEQKISKSRNIPFIFTREERELYMSIKEYLSKGGISK